MSTPQRTQPDPADAALREVEQLGGRLARTPMSSRDLRWHVLAALVGDLPALAAARIRLEPPPAA